MPNEIVLNLNNNNKKLTHYSTINCCCGIRSGKIDVSQVFPKFQVHDDLLKLNSGRYKQSKIKYQESNEPFSQQFLCLRSKRANIKKNLTESAPHKRRLVENESFHCECGSFWQTSLQRNPLSPQTVATYSLYTSLTTSFGISSLKEKQN